MIATMRTEPEQRPHEEIRQLATEEEENRQSHEGGAEEEISGQAFFVVDGGDGRVRGLNAEVDDGESAAWDFIAGHRHLAVDNRACFNFKDGNVHLLTVNLVLVTCPAKWLFLAGIYFDIGRPA